MTEEYDGPEIIDAIQDQTGRRWICVRGLHAKQPLWFPVDELATSGTALFKRLSIGGIDILTNSGKERFRKAVANHKDYRLGLSAQGPGWLDDVFVGGDGKVRSTTASDNVVIGFLPDHRFASHGSLEAATAALTPLIRGQKLLLFLKMYSLGPALLNFASPDIGNPIIEIVGETGSGKTTAGTFAMSTWAGDPTSNVGGGTTWNRTLMTLDAAKAAHDSMMILLDETNHISEEGRAKILKDAIFSLEATGSRVRFGDAIPQNHSRLATLSTSNVPLADIMRGKGEDKRAVASRVLTLLLGPARPHGILDHIPAGYSSAEAAVVALRASCNANYAVLGHAFIDALVARDPRKIQQNFNTLYQRALVTSNFEELTPRHRKTLALTIVAGQMAVRLGVVPLDWGDIIEAVHLIRGDDRRRRRHRSGG